MQIVSNWRDFKFADHLFFNSSSEINTLIQPLVKHFGLDSFVYQKNFDDGSEIRLSNQPKWMEFFYTNELYKSSIFEPLAGEFKRQFFLWTNLQQHKIVLDYAAQHGIRHGITMIDRVDDGYEFFFFGSTLIDGTMVNKYIPHLDMLEKFTIYFKEKASDLIKRAFEERLIIANKDLATQGGIIVESIDRTAFLQDIMPLKLTLRELECAKLLFKGYTAKMIANELNISFRTVEDYINKLKIKSGTTHKNELITFLEQWF